MSPNPKLYRLTAPLDMEDARAAYKDLGQQRIQAREQLERAVEEAADAEREYRKGLSQAFVRAEGGTAAEREASARAIASDLAYRRDVRAGMVKVAQQRLEEIDAVRQSLNRLVEWSRAIDPLALEDRAPRAVA